ncbi:MAG: tripartite tricarboxylate transporter substrate binding protein [Rhodovarius sp.]|nr:tripartite tricarboxylate transporter substrate binding protein [Rhodovarius sp.]
MTQRAISRRRWMAAAAAAPVVVRVASAQRLSGRPVTIIVPFSAGSGPDLVARIFAEWMQRRWNQPFIVDNRVGASGNIGTAAVARAAPDGHTLLLTANTLAMNVSLFRSLPYDPIASFAPVVMLVESSFVLVAAASAPGDLRGFLELARRRPGEVTYASPGIGTPHHLAMELFRRRAGIDLTHVPYRGLAQAVSDVTGGQVAAMFLPASAALELARSGRVQLLAVAAAQRLPIAPQLPTLAELGVAGVDVDNWWGLLAPAGTADAIIAQLNGAANEMLADPAIAQRLTDQGLTLRGGPPELLRRQIAADLIRWAAVVREAGITPE